MTLQEWEKKLKKYLSPLPKSEQNRIVEYYREMYGDKIDNGCSEAEILAEFGDPQVCAGRMISENADTEEQEQPIFAPIKQPKQPKQPQQAQSAQQAQPTGNPYVGNPYVSSPYVGNPYLSSAAGANIANTNATNNAPMAQTATDKAKKSPSVGAVIGWIFFTLLIGIPVMAVIVSVIASLAAVFISGIAVAVAGAVFAVASLFFGIFGVPASGIFASLGLGLAASGVGILLAIGFSFATKYTAVYTFKGVRWLYAGRKRQ